MRRVLVAALALGLAAALHAQRGAPRQFELRAESPRFNDLVEPAATLEKVAGGFGFTEGPVWNAAGGFLYVDDEQKNTIWRVFPDGRVESFLSIRDPDGAAFDRRGRLIVCLSTLRSVIAVNPDATHQTLVDRYEGKKLNSPNDVVLGSDGAMYFTDPTIDLPKGEAQELPTGVYRLDANAAPSSGPGTADVVLLTSDLAQPNGLAFSPDGAHLYVSDTERREIRVYDVVYRPAVSLRNGRVFGRMDAPGGVPDGLRVDVNGHLFATGPLGVWVWDSEGRHLGTIVLPEQPANVAWGDADYSTLYFTARTSVYRLKTKTKGFVP